MPWTTWETPTSRAILKFPTLITWCRNHRRHYAFFKSLMIFYPKLIVFYLSFLIYHSCSENDGARSRIKVWIGFNNFQRGVWFSLKPRFSLDVRSEKAGIALSGKITSVSENSARWLADPCGPAWKATACDDGPFRALDCQFLSKCKIRVWLHKLLICGWGLSEFLSEGNDFLIIRWSRPLDCGISQAQAQFYFWDNSLALISQSGYE